MKGILKIYHPEETLKYTLKSTHCKALFSNNEHFLDIELITEDMDNVEDDSLQYPFPQLSLSVSNFPIPSEELKGQQFSIEENEEEGYTEINLFCDDEAFLYENQLTFQEGENQELQLVWQGKVEDFYTNTEELIPFKLKCVFKEEEQEIEDEE